MLAQDQKRTHNIAFGETDEHAGARQLQHMYGRGSLRPQSAEPAHSRSVQGRLADALLGLAIAEKRLFSAKRENERLRISNEQLMRSLDDTARLAVAAQRVAHHDRLTGLPNRLLLIKRLQLAIKNAAERHRQLALLFIDLDGFKVVNDGLGHTIADRLLSSVAARISACVRADDIACRYGGDEFVVLLTNLNDAAIAIRVAEQIRERIGQCYSIDGKEVHITASIGLAGYPADGERYEALLNRADASMYCDKAGRRAHAASSEMSGFAGPGPR